jgi:hypothetical protein
MAPTKNNKKHRLPMTPKVRRPQSSEKDEMAKKIHKRTKCHIRVDIQ